MEPQTMSPELKLFFERLLGIKKFVKDHAESSQDKILMQIYEKLEALIKRQEQ